MPDDPNIPIHDAILPWVWDGVTWAIVNLSSNVETENSSMADLFESTNRHLMTLTNMRDCFVINPPSVTMVKAHHNLHMRLNLFIDSRTKMDNEERFDIVHITPKRRRFTRYPVRYWDQKNRFTKRWSELCLYGLSNFAQMAEANTYVGDWNVNSAHEMKKPFKEAYRIMAIDLFGKSIGEAGADGFVLTQADFDNYNPSALVPSYENLEIPYLAQFTEQRLRDVSTPNIKPGEGVTSTGGSTISPGESGEQRTRDNQAANPIVP